MWRMEVKTVDNEATWDEPITIRKLNFSCKPLPIDTTKTHAEEVAKSLIDYFNSTLRKGEVQRELVNVFKD